MMAKTPSTKTRSGTLGLCFEDEEMVLGTEDAAYIRGSRPHGYRRAVEPS